MTETKPHKIVIESNGNRYLAETAFKPYSQYNWQPQPDITTYELALCLPVFFFADRGVGEQIDKLPAEAQRHFVEVK